MTAACPQTEEQREGGGQQLQEKQQNLRVSLMAAASSVFTRYRASRGAGSERSVCPERETSLPVTREAGEC